MGLVIATEMPKLSQQGEERYLEYVQENIVAREDELQELLNMARDGAVDNKAGQSLRNQYRESAVPDPDLPYVIRVDLANGEIRYYGGIRLNKTSKDPIPESHKNVVDGLLILSTSSDGKGYTADYAENLPDLVARTRYDIRKGTLHKYYEEKFSQGSKPGGVVAEELVSDNLQQTREQKMKTITSTLQPDQFKITREPSTHSLAIQGPPGSGKTAVLLERLARIAYADENVRKKGMLLIGPNKPFMDYVSQVLPALGETEIMLKSIDDLSGYAKHINSKSVESLTLLALKGSEAMKEIIDRYVSKQTKVLSKTTILRLGDVSIQLTPYDSYLLLESVRAENIRTFTQERKVFEARLKSVLVDRYQKEWKQLGRELRAIPGDPAHFIAQESTFKTIVRNVYPNVDPVGLLSRLKTDGALFLDIAKDSCEESELRAWLKESESQASLITPDDVPILDYLDSLLNEQVQKWGHIGIDEAQDLSPLEFMMVARRLDARATVSLAGDLAQATGTFWYDSWELIMQKLELEEAFTQRELHISYRVPSDIIEYAGRFLGYAGVEVPASRTFFQRDNSLVFSAIGDNRLRLAEATSKAVELLGQDESVLIIATYADRMEIQKHTFPNTIKAHVSILDPREVKGLEFDHVVILNPLSIIEDLEWETSRLARLFYVLTTRATKSLTLIGDDLESLKFPLLGLDDLINEVKTSEGNEIETSDAEDNPNQDLTEQDEEKELDELIRASDELFEAESIREAIGIFASATDRSILDLCDELNVPISQASGDFLVGQWIYAGNSQVRCLDCREKPQMVFTKHLSQNSDHGLKAHAIAIACKSCALIREYSAKFGALEDLLMNMNFEKLILKECELCGVSK